MQKATPNGWLFCFQNKAVLQWLAFRRCGSTDVKAFTQLGTLAPGACPIGISVAIRAGFVVTKVSDAYIQTQQLEAE